MNLSKRKIAVVITARPSYSRIQTALSALKRHPVAQLQLVVAGSALLNRYGEAVRVIENDGFDIAARVYMVIEGENLAAMAKTTGLGLLELATVFDNLEPDVVITIADRFETMATAIAATYMNIPLVHIQGGEISGSIDEKVRHSVTKLADLHYVSTANAAERVIRMGEDPDTVFVTGCPSIDLARAALDAPQMDFDPFSKYGGVGDALDLSNGYLVVLQHPVTTEYGAARRHVTETLRAVNDSGLPALWFWPNVDAGADGTSTGIRSFREIERPKNMHFFKNMVPMDFLRLLINAKALVGNSSVGIRESALLGVPVVNIGSRQAGRDRDRNVLDVGYSQAEILQGIRKQVERGQYPSSSLYGNGDAGERIADLVTSSSLSIKKKLAY